VQETQHSISTAMNKEICNLILFIYTRGNNSAYKDTKNISNILITDYLYEKIRLKILFL